MTEQGPVVCVISGIYVSAPLDTDDARRNESALRGHKT
jgi:hypothetical protein